MARNIEKLKFLMIKCNKILEFYQGDDIMGSGGVPNRTIIRVDGRSGDLLVN